MNQNFKQLIYNLISNSIKNHFKKINSNWIKLNNLIASI